MKASWVWRWSAVSIYRCCCFRRRRYCFPQLVQRVLEGKSLNDLQGVYTQTGPSYPNNGHYPNAPSVQDMDSLPYPDYDDFFDQLEKSTTIYLILLNSDSNITGLLVGRKDKLHFLRS